MAELPPLPPFVVGEATGVRWATYRVNRRVHCDACVWLRHFGGWAGVPCQANSRRTGFHFGLLAGRPKRGDLFLCREHGATWKGLDDAAKELVKPKRRAGWTRR